MATPPPATLADFKAQFARDFIYGTGKDTVMDGDITRALNESGMVFNPVLWDSGDDKIAFLYASAHFLVLNVQAAGGLSAKPFGQGINSQGAGVVGSKSVGSVSVSYIVPEFVSSSPFLSQFMKTDYGQKYLQLLTPRLVGHVSIAQGPSEPDVAVPNIPGMFNQDV